MEKMNVETLVLGNRNCEIDHELEKVEAAHKTFDEIPKKNFGVVHTAFDEIYVVDYMSELKELKQVASVKEYYESFVNALNRSQRPQEYSLSCFIDGLNEDIRYTIQLEYVGETEINKDVEKVALDDVEEQKDSVSQVVNESPQDSIFIVPVGVTTNVTRYLERIKRELLYDTSCMQDVCLTLDVDEARYGDQKYIIVSTNGKDANESGRFTSSISFRLGIETIKITSTKTVVGEESELKEVAASNVELQLQEPWKFDRDSLVKVHGDEGNFDITQSDIENFANLFVMEDGIGFLIKEHGNIEVPLAKSNKYRQSSSDLVTALVAENFKWKPSLESLSVEKGRKIRHDSNKHRFVDMRRNGSLIARCLKGLKVHQACEGQIYVVSPYVKLLVNLCYNVHTRGVVKGVEAVAHQAMFCYNLRSVDSENRVEPNVAMELPLQFTSSKLANGELISSRLKGTLLTDKQRSYLVVRCNKVVIQGNEASVADESLTFIIFETLCLVCGFLQSISLLELSIWKNDESLKERY
nr:hypothetical protein [Tanacetum cinerariifolium]